MQKLVFINGSGNEIDLTSGNFGITNWAGLSNVPLNIQTQQVPFEDGSIFLDALMEQREIEVTVAVQDNNNLELRYQKKRELISALNPKLGEGTLIYTNDYLSRQIKAVPQIPLFENKNSNDAGTLKASIAFTCCAPYWEDAEENIVAFGLREQPLIQNEGDIPCQLKMEVVTDNATNPTVRNLTTEKEIKYNGTITKNLIINTEAGKKSATLGDMELYLSNMGFNLNAICYAEEKKLFVAVGDYGNFIKSTDGKKWESIIDFSHKEMFDIIYAKGLFVCVGDTGTIFSSPDLENWTSRTSGTSYKLNSIAYSEELDLFVAVGVHGTIITSPDLETWTSQTSGITIQLNRIKYVNFIHKFIAVGKDRHFLSSDDGENWTDYIYPVYTGNFDVLDLDFSDELEKIVAVTSYGTNTYFLTSQDGTSWNSPYPASPQYTPIGSRIHYIKKLGMFITDGYYISYDGQIFDRILSDMTTWEKDLAYSEDLDSIVFVGNDLIIKTFGLTTYEAYQSKISGSFNDICYARKLDLFVGVTTDGKVYTSKDKINWIERYASESVCTRIIFSENKGILVAIGNTLLYSYNGIDWVEKAGEGATDIVYSEEKGIFVKVGGIGSSYNVGFIDYSYNGIDWTSLDRSIIHSDYAFVSVCYSETMNIFATVNERGVVYSSSNAIQWTPHTIVENRYFSTILYSESIKKFILVGGDTYRTSDDGVFWEDKSNILPENLEILKIYYNPETGTLSGVVCNFSNGVLNNYRAFTSLDMTSIRYYKATCGIKFLKDCYVGWGSGKQIVLSQSIEGENVINNIDEKSDMNLNLQIGENRFRLITESGNAVCKITFRQKYIGV